MTVRVRFAPSPTGYLHIGGLRTALYNYLFARQNGGTFVLRIEDTDRKRLVEGSVDNLIQSLRWAGLTFDEGPEQGGDCGPYMQSQRLEMYQTYAKQLIDQGDAYYAFDTAEELEAMREEQRQQKVPSVFYDRKRMKNSLSRSEEDVKAWIRDGVPYVIRMKVPDDQKTFTVQDILRGDVTFQREHVDDQVLIKTDGFPTYHMASVVDDHHMGITHIIRGEEWISSVPKHLVLYKFFGWDVPKMVHLPLILNQDRSKLSKRQNDVAVEDYRDKGYMPEALINYMAMLGWSPGSAQEMFDMDALIKEFSLDRLNKSGSVFDVEKLNWFNAQHMRQTPVEELLPQAKEHLAKAEMDLSMYDDEGLKAIIGMLTERITTIAELPEAASYFFADPDSYHEKTVKKRWKETSAELVVTYADALEALDTFTAEAAEETLKGIVEDKGIKAGALLLPTRLTISGIGGGPALFSIMETLGKETCLRRLRSGAETLG